MSSRNLIIYGAGGFGSEVAAIAESGCHAGRDTPRWSVIGFVDDLQENHGRHIHGVPCLGSLSEIIAARQGEETWCYIALGDNEERRKAAARIAKAGWHAATVVHFGAGVAWGIELGEGTFIGMHATVSPSVKIGRHVVINTRGSIGHHAQLGDFSQISLGASVLGHGKVDEGAFIGAHAVVASGVTVGAWATVAIGTPALASVKPGHTICLPLARTLFKRNLPPV